jgi:hypothetical protein
MNITLNVSLKISHTWAYQYMYAGTCIQHIIFYQKYEHNLKSFTQNLTYMDISIHICICIIFYQKYEPNFKCFTQNLAYMDISIHLCTCIQYIILYQKYEHNFLSVPMYLCTYLCTYFFTNVFRPRYFLWSRARE